LRSRVLRRTLLLTAAIAAIAPAAALAVTPVPPTEASAFTPAQIPVGGTTALSFTITNPNTSKLTLVGLSETLPSGLVIDNPNGASGTCGSAGVLTAISGGTAITLTGGSLAAGANCVVSVDVTSNTPGSYQNNSVGASSHEGGTGTGDTQTLQVVSLPTIAITSPKNNATFAFGKKVKLVFTCTEGAGGPGINDCEADDDATGASYLGAPYASDQLLDTKTPGKHTLTFLAVSLDAGQTNQDFTYTVQPDNHFTVSTPKPGKHGKLAFGLKLPGAGSVSVTETTAGGKKTTIASKTTTVKGKKTLKLTLAPSKSAAKLLAALTGGTKKGGKKKTKQNPTLAAKLTISYTPKHGVKRTQTVKGIQLQP
jgi:hypothetical protein